VVWSYELSRTWAANNRDAVEHRRLTCDPTYEVELELVDAGGEYLRERTDEEVAESIVLKAKALLAEDLPLQLLSSQTHEQPPRRHRKRK